MDYTKKSHIAICTMSTLSESCMNEDKISSIPVEYAEFNQSTSLDEKQEKPKSNDNDSGKIILSEYYDEDGNLVVEANDMSTKSGPSDVISIPEGRKKKKKRLSRQDSNK